MDAGCRVVDQSINPTGISVQAQPRFSSRFGWRSEVSGHPAAAGGRCQIGLSRPSRNQEGKANPSAVRANSDDPPIYIRPNVPASAGAKDKNPVGSSHYGSRTMASRFFDRKGFLRRKRQQSGDKGLISCSASTAASARSAFVCLFAKSGRFVRSGPFACVQVIHGVTGRFVQNRTLSSNVAHRARKPA